MALADIEKRNADERRREKRLVHVTNALCRDFLDSAGAKARTKSQKEATEYLTKSLLDYVFFEERKELKELTEDHIRQFMTGYAPRKLQISSESGAEALDIVSDFLMFLDASGHIRNGAQLSDAVKSNKREFLKLLPHDEEKGKSKKASDAGRPTKAKPQKTSETEARVGRNDPCPCGSGKKYKKCCGQAK